MARKRVMKGGFFSSVYRKFQKDRIADCKDWLKKQQKKRKMKGGSKGSQAGSGGAYALSKLIGRGKRKNQSKRKKGARKGARKGAQKQTGGSKSWKDSRLRRDLKDALSFI